MYEWKLVPGVRGSWVCGVAIPLKEALTSVTAGVKGQSRREKNVCSIHILLRSLKERDSSWQKAAGHLVQLTKLGRTGEKKQPCGASE